MEKYICDKCGFNLEIPDEPFDEICPICKGSMIELSEMQAREDIAKQISEDTPDAGYTPQEDATDEAVSLIIQESMIKNIKELGNDGTFRSIELLPNAKMRVQYRKYFIMVGGQVPVGEAITI